jgi:acetyltransferase-like isoleucine patch superfamily enzyme
MNALRLIYARSLAALDGCYRRWYWVKGRLHASLYGGRIHWSRSANAFVPVRCSGEGEVYIAENVNFGFRQAPMMGNGEILLQARGKTSTIRIGRGTAMSNNVSIVAMQSVEIGERCLIGELVTIFDADFHRIHPAERWNGSDPPSPVRIGNNVWLGSRVMVLKGVNIGENCVIAAGAVVTKSVPPNTIAAGVPAIVIRQLTPHHHTD